MKLKKWELSLIIAFCVTLLLGMGLLQEQKELSGSLLRLHVVANSDSYEDQKLKLVVRDIVLEKIRPMLDGVAERDEAVLIIEQNLNDISHAVNAETGTRISVSVGEERFPTTRYDTFTLPAGQYKALRVQIGDATGGNWWCVMFPQLCTDGFTPAAQAREALDSLPDNQVALITGTGTGYAVRFRALEWIESVFGSRRG